MTGNEALIAAPLMLILGIATIWDWREQKIPNVLSFGAALFGIVLQGSLHGASGALFAAGGWVVCLVCFLPFYLRGGMAAGDVKLMAAAGAFLGPMPGFFACLFTLIAGGLIAVVSLACLRFGLPLGFPADSAVGTRAAAMRIRIPYAGAIAAGTSFVLLVPSVVPSALLHFGA